MGGGGQTDRLAAFRLSPGGWLLAALLTVLAVRAATLDRSDWPGFIGDEGTYLMAAESLAWDGDFRYERADYDRFRDRWGELGSPFLVLQSPDRGQTLVFGKPFFYPLFVAPLTRLWPTHGVVLSNVLLLSLAAALAARALRVHLDSEAPLWVAVLLFGSVAFGYSLWAQPDSFLMSLVMIAFSLAVHDRERRTVTSRRDASARHAGQVVRWCVIGALIAVVVFSRPLYGPLLVPLALCLPRPGLVRAAAALGVAFVVVTGAAAAARWDLAGAVTSYTGERAGFDPLAALELEASGESWDRALERGSASWYEARQPFRPKLERGLWFWNSIYYAFGEHVGLLPYFLPLVLTAFAFRGGAVHWSLLLAVGASIAAFLVYRPFNFFGGGATIGNRYFLPLYPALWFLVARRPSRWIRQRAPVAVVALSGLFVWPVWLGLGDYPLREDQAPRFVSPAARALLPYETTQSHLKPAGQEDVIHGGLWVKPLGSGVRVDERRIWVRRGAWAELLIASASPLDELQLFAPAGPDSALEISTGEVSGRELADGVVVYRLEMPRPRARHAMWWSWRPLDLYRLRFRVGAQADGTVAGLHLARVPALAARNGATSG